MKYLLFIVLFFASCVPEVELPTMDAPVPESTSISYVGYELYALQLNEDGTYRITLYLPDNIIEVITSVPASDITIVRDKPLNLVFKQYDNYQQTGKYVVYLQPNYIITNFYI